MVKLKIYLNTIQFIHEIIIIDFFIICFESVYFHCYQWAKTIIQSIFTNSLCMRTLLYLLYFAEYVSCVLIVQQCKFRQLKWPTAWRWKSRWVEFENGKQFFKNRGNNFCFGMNRERLDLNYFSKLTCCDWSELCISLFAMCFNNSEIWTN